MKSDPEKRPFSEKRPFTVDASVHINALNPAEAGSAESQAFLKALYDRALPVYLPTLLLVEVAAAAVRALNDNTQAIAVAEAIHQLPQQVWIALDEALAETAAHLAVENRLRGADAVYAAMAKQYNTTLVTRDRQQLERLRSIISVKQPAEALLAD